MSKQKMSRRIAKLKKEELWDDEMQEYTDVYLDFLKAAAIEYPSKPYVAIEKKLSYSNYARDGFGTADCIMIGGNTLHIIDFKYGKGVEVSPESNPQLMLYALGAMDVYAMIYDIQHISCPSYSPEPVTLDGRGNCPKTRSCNLEKRSSECQLLPGKERATITRALNNAGFVGRVIYAGHGRRTSRS